VTSAAAGTRYLLLQTCCVSDCTYCTYGPLPWHQVLSILDGSSSSWPGVSDALADLEALVGLTGLLLAWLKYDY
jgi:hypothetical protein